MEFAREMAWGSEVARKRRKMGAKSSVCAMAMLGSMLEMRVGGKNDRVEEEEDVGEKVPPVWRTAPAETAEVNSEARRGIDAEEIRQPRSGARRVGWLLGMRG